MAIETTEKFGSVALLDGDRLLADVPLPKDRRSAQTLAWTIDRLFREPNLLDLDGIEEKAEITPRCVKTVAVVVGPGSFTGLRVGVATAKMFAYAVGAKIVGVKTHDVIAESFATKNGLTEKELGTKCLSAGVDAQRGEVVVQDFEFFADRRYEALDAPKLISVSDWWKKAEQLENVLFAGPALERWYDKVPDGISIADECFWTPFASVAGQIAAKKIRAGESDDPWTLVPVYSRLSAAEERTAPPQIELPLGK